MQLSDLREAAASLLAQEYKIIKDLHHPNIVNYLQVNIDIFYIKQGIRIRIRDMPCNGETRRRIPE